MEDCSPANAELLETTCKQTATESDNNEILLVARLMVIPPILRFGRYQKSLSLKVIA
jgi:hypothetical protein